MTKKITIQFTSGPDTRWLQDDEFLTRQLKFISASVAQSLTTGSEPSVEAWLDKSQPELLTTEAQSAQRKQCRCGGLCDSGTPCPMAY